jgi:hypothetical protein
MKKISLLLLLISSILFAQKEKSSKMGQTTLEELKMTIYDKDSAASAVVLYEHYNRYPALLKKFVPKIDVYRRIKFFDKNSLDKATIKIYLRNNEEISNIEGITYNLSEKGTIKTTILSEKDLFSLEKDENYTVKTFTLPNIKEGTVIEYSYTVISNYLTIDDWYFQSDIPKIKSEFDAAILGNYKYNARIIGFKKLDKDTTTVKINCADIPIIGVGACVVYSFGMNNVPAFKDEDYMLSKKNYLSRVSLDIQSVTNYRGMITNYTKTWREADKSLKNYFFNKQTSKKSFFKKQLPEELLNEENDLKKARGIYHFIKSHYTWNKRNWTNEDIDVKEAFKEKVGDVGEINLSLFNSLIAAKLNAELVVLSTRENGLPTKLFPVIFDFNYVITKLVLNNKNYYLDATDKFLPFGKLPIRTLNGEARVVNYTKESSWELLKATQKDFKNVQTKLTLNKNGELAGDLTFITNGYYALEKRRKIDLLTEENYLEDLESNAVNIEFEKYNSENTEELDKPLIENFNIKIFTNEFLSNKVRINPFFFDRIKENPFKLKERNYPVDFAYPRKNNYSLSLQVPETYKITQLPKDIAIGLPNNGGKFILKVQKKNNIITLFVRFSVNKKSYSSAEYFYLKEFFKQIIIAESTDIILEKIN